MKFLPQAKKPYEYYEILSGELRGQIFPLIKREGKGIWLEAHGCMINCAEDDIQEAGKNA